MSGTHGWNVLGWIWYVKEIYYHMNACSGIGLWHRATQYDRSGYSDTDIKSNVCILSHLEHTAEGTPNGILSWTLKSLLQCRSNAISGMIAKFGEIAKFGLNILAILARWQKISILMQLWISVCKGEDLIVAIYIGFEMKKVGNSPEPYWMNPLKI